jgi:hypothetical protein
MGHPFYSQKIGTKFPDYHFGSGVMGGHHDKEEKLIDLIQSESDHKIDSKKVERAWKKVLKYVYGHQGKDEVWGVFPLLTEHLWQNRKLYNLDAPILVEDNFEPYCPHARRGLDAEEREKALFEGCVQWSIIHAGKTSFVSFFLDPAHRPEEMKLWPPQSKKLAQIAAAEREKQRLLDLFHKVCILC